MAPSVRSGPLVSDTSKVPAMPTGLRHSGNSSPAYPPVILFPSNASGAQLEPSKTRPRAVHLSAEAPLTPTTSATGHIKKSWVNSASKTFGFRRLRRKTSFTREDALSRDSGGPVRTQSTRKLYVQPHNLAGSSRSPVPAPLTHQLQDSPAVPTGANHLHHPVPSEKTDKPLPSLPVATVKYQSPVRRSLIDCTEKPLKRRSMTPTEVATPEEDDWPPILPTKSYTNLPSYGNQSQIKPSLGESLYEGMRALDLQDNKEGTSETQPKAQFDNTADSQETHPHMASQAEEKESAAEELLSDGRRRPLSSSQLPKPRDSMLQSLSRHVDSPVAVRQTKTSTMRLQQATGKSTWDPNEKNKLANSHIPTIREQAESPSPSWAKQTVQGGPVRVNSRGRCAVTGRGSPYTIPSRAHPGRKPLHHNENNSYGRSLRTPTNGQEEIATRPSASPTRKSRKDSLPLPARLLCPSTNIGDELGVATGPSTAEPILSLATKEQKNSDVGTHQGSTLSGHDGSHGNSRKLETDAVSQPQLLTVKEVLSTPAPDETESFVDSDEDNSEVSVRGYDSFGGYRIRRVGNNGSKIGPTLRITDSASRVLLGPEDRKSTLDANSPVKLRHKRSAPDVASPRMARDQLRRSSAIYSNLPSPMAFARHLSDRSPFQDKAAGQDEAWPRVDANSSVDAVVVRAELPGSEGTFGAHSIAESGDNLTSEAAASRLRSDIKGTPASDHGDWPGKDFAEFNLGSDATPTASKHDAPAAKPGFRRPAHSKSPSRPPTVVLREAPSKETAPFLFQDLEQEQAKQEKLANDLAEAAGSGSESSVNTQPTDPVTTANSTPSMSSVTMPFPPRTSSRKPKPPPIIVSPPSISFFPNPAPKAYAVQPESLQKPRYVKPFSQSISPVTNSVKGRKVSNVLAHSPSTSGKKKVVSSLRGLFHKKSFESTKATVASDPSVAGDTVPLPVIPALVYEGDGPRRASFRRKPVPPFAPRDETNSRKFSNPLHPNPYATSTGMRQFKHKNPLISPTTPWTANLKTPLPPNAAATTTGVASNAKSTPSSTSISASVTNLPRAQPSPVGNSSPSMSLSPATPAGPPSLSAATTLTHNLLDIVRSTTNPTHKSHLIELSKCMVEVVNSARDAEKAMEKARMEASRAEVAYLKCAKQVVNVQGLIREITDGGVNVETRVATKDQGMTVKEV
ncbi:hypothetical protein A1O7_03891 [Cladophialophora yegresii CBS 114405]|uniref:Uncharacterized protein n=1 Tax=Cladophialophora yegresii CBS 114405 TaxID=1182544 RepID=W9WMS7_9EURO|nr:uncharacterized protein A1O7_03891 [Cladophialophora yegresii CBS 114405]EXJ59744.1 hypothetical protein A1O7_03891 [Cladophialophora yegresii CBS 114405]